jgi:hypothetical protein
MFLQEALGLIDANATNRSLMDIQAYAVELDFVSKSLSCKFAEEEKKVSSLS